MKPRYVLSLAAVGGLATPPSYALRSDTSICADYAWATHGPNAELRVHATLKAAGGAALFHVRPL